MLDRRHFLAASAAGILGCSRNNSSDPTATPITEPVVPPAAEPRRDAVRLAMVGISNRGMENLKGVAGEQIVALCDVDETNTVARKMYPRAEFFTDYRKMFDKVGASIDAAVISTPDHTHAHAALSAAALGKHIYCEKPLCRTVGEVRRLMKVAAEKKLITQMGTQIHSLENYRRAVEIVRSGALGTVRKASAWCSRQPTPGKILPPPTDPLGFDTDRWLGPVREEFFYAGHNTWPHFNWRWWWPFGGGILADMGCHFMDLIFWAMDLGQPSSVKATGTPLKGGDNTVPATLRVDYIFPATATRGEFELSWYHGVPGPSLQGEIKTEGYHDGVLFEGDNGKKLLADYIKLKVLPDEFAKDFKAPEPSIAKSPGHHKEWLDAIRGNGKPLCHFGYSGVLTQAVLLGNIAYRTGAALKWDGAQGITDNAAANQLLAFEPRKGWEWPA